MFIFLLAFRFFQMRNVYDAVQLKPLDVDQAFITIHKNTSRALSFRNLVLGYECGRVFPKGVVLNSTSRDAMN